MPMSTPVVTRYRIGSIELDTACRCIRRDGREEHPRARVFELLLYLVENRERPVSKQELVDRVWASVAITDSVLYKTVLELRRVLGDDPDSPVYVKTLPKLGYQFVGPVEADAPSAPAPAAPAPPASVVDSRRRPWLWVVAAATLGALVGGWALLREGPSEAPAGEIAWWRFDERAGETARDSAGRNHGRLLAAPSGGTPPHWGAGRSGNALSLGGGNLVEGELKTPEWSGVTMMAWVEPQEIVGGEATVFDSRRFRLALAPEGILLIRNESVGAVQPRRPRGWRHVAAVDEGPITGVGRIFVDGAEVASGVFSPVQRADARWRIGESLRGNAAFRGLIDDVRVYGRPLRKLEIEAIYRCGKEAPDLTAGGKSYYYLPVFAQGAEIGPDGSISNGAKDFGGVQLAERSDCGVARMRGADLGQDVRIGLDIALTRDGDGRTTEGGPYLRSRRAYPGDGIAGGASAGYWVKLGSDGQIRVWQLRPFHAIAASAAPATFDAQRFHRLEAAAEGGSLRVWLDGRQTQFEQDGRVVDAVAIQATPAGMGTVGVAFSADRNRGSLGGQRVRNLAVESLAK
jgi:DNA-binding winged helix-turn-helix (wHTH) protein